MSSDSKIFNFTPMPEGDDQDMHIVAPAFAADYIPQEHRAVVGKATQAIQARVANIVDNLFDIGEQLAVVKDILEYGTFLTWIKEFGFKERTAQRLMNIYRQLGTRAEILRQVKPTALYELSKPSTPEVAVDAVVKRLMAGERLSVREVFDIIAACKGNPPRKELTFSEGVAKALHHALKDLSDQIVFEYKKLRGAHAASQLDKARKALRWHLDQVQSLQPSNHSQPEVNYTVVSAPASIARAKMQRKAKSGPQLSYSRTGEEYVSGSADDAQVVIGCTVLIRNMDTDEIVNCTIVEDESSNPQAGHISAGSPVARAVLGARVGEIAMAQTPDGTISYAVIGIRFADGRLAGTGFGVKAESGQSATSPEPIDQADITTDTSQAP